MKEIVLPGDKIGDETTRMPHTFVEGNATYAAVIGIKDEQGRYIPLEARYKPRRADVLVGVVTSIKHAGYEVDVGMPEEAFIQARDVRVELPLGSVIMAEVQGVEGGEIKLARVRKLPGGKLLEFPPAKVPRLIGKQSSMINMISEKTHSEIVVGNNGYVWISENSDIPKVLKAVNMIRQNAHISGLTDRIAALLSQ